MPQVHVLVHDWNFFPLSERKNCFRTLANHFAVVFLESFVVDVRVRIIRIYDVNGEWRFVITPFFR